MDLKKVSVILPVYNVAPYLRQSLDSLVNQSLKEVEILCVDDGSTDESYQILEEYKQKYPQITLMQQKNQGAGVARNTGLACAKGKYLLFLDPDDFFQLDMLEALYQRGEETQAEMVICHAMGFNQANQQSYQIHRYYNRNNLPDKEIFSHLDMEEKIFSTFGFTVWNKLLRRDFVLKEELRFQEVFRLNDIFFVASALISAQKIAVLDRSLLFYRTNMETQGKKKFQKYPLSQYQAFLAIYEMLERKQVSPQVVGHFLPIALKFTLIYYHNAETFFSQKAIYQKIHQDMEQDFHLSTLSPQAYVASQWAEYQAICATPYDQYLYQQGQDREAEITPIYWKLLREKHQNLCFFGAGLECQKLLAAFRREEVPPPVAICDNSPTLQGTQLEGIPVLSFPEMVARYPDLALMITLKNDYSDVEAQAKTRLQPGQILRV